MNKFWPDYKLVVEDEIHEQTGLPRPLMKVISINTTLVFVRTFIFNSKVYVDVYHIKIQRDIHGLNVEELTLQLIESFVKDVNRYMLYANLAIRTEYGDFTFSGIKPVHTYGLSEMFVPEILLRYKDGNETPVFKATTR